MTTGQVGLVYIFYSYAREDKKLRDRLEKHLSILKCQNLVSHWHNVEIDAHQEWQDSNNLYLDMANIILLLLSPGFMASDRSYNMQMKRVLNRHETGEARVIPVLLRPVYWQETPFAKLKILPSNARPVVKWRDRDEAFVNVIEELQKVIRELTAEIQTRGVEIFELKRLRDDPLEQESLEDFDEDAPRSISRVFPSPPGDFKESTYPYRGHLEAGTDHYYKEALDAYNRSLRHWPEKADAALYAHKAGIQFALKLYAEAEATYTQALHLAPGSAELYRGRARAFYALDRFTDALADYATAITLEPGDAYTHYSHALVLHALKDLPRARAAYAQAIALDPRIAETYQDDEYALLEPPGVYFPVTP
ncbi:MAG: TIR domain-containing protein [Ktedonobacteraceae bacterium]|nr:TIR domain-containing protein [Ktedonobacteraceae bacterium]